jgi:very-short-patch-repair endonuclease
MIIRGGSTRKQRMKAQKQQLFNAKKQKLKRQMLRNNATHAEKKLWAHLQKSQLFGHKFRRQQGIGPFIVDFYCAKVKVAVELDGDVHSSAEAREYDRNRDAFLRHHGITTIRFRNKEVFTDVDSVLQTIVEHLHTTSPVL